MKEPQICEDTVLCMTRTSTVVSFMRRYINIIFHERQCVSFCEVDPRWRGVRGGGRPDGGGDRPEGGGGHPDGGVAAQKGGGGRPDGDGC